jgi:hypothetical protein
MRIRLCLGNKMDTDRVEDLGVDGRIILKYILNKIRCHGLTSSGS